MEIRNRLADESSAYLRQHRANPVAWWPWGDAPFAEARRRDCPVLVSIGYSSCHWCHVMEREAFEDPDVADLMNRELVSIKVDREERPDVDQIYMDAVMRLTGQGGWPLNVFCLPDGRPFFGGTYFPPERMYGRPSWIDVVHAIVKLYREQHDRVCEQADQIMAVLQSFPELEPRDPPGAAGLRELTSQLLQQADTRHGGFGGAPKFPTAPNLMALLQATAQGLEGPGTGDPGSEGARGTLGHVLFTLVCMARGGIYDQLGGGFHRYSTDVQWLVPHFEKMLYDNGQLLRVYAEAYRQTGDSELEWPVAETIAYLERDMQAPSGGFFASQDADSEGEEGRFYVWDPEEIRAVLGAEPADAFCEAYGVSPTGNFEVTGKSVLQHLGLGQKGRLGDRPSLAELRAALLRARSERVPPATDTKHVAAWIGYAISGIATAAATWHRRDWLSVAERAASFVSEQLGEAHGTLCRVWDGEQAKIPAFLDDFAALLEARLDLLRASGDGRHARAAIRLADQICREFVADDRRDLYFVRPGDASLIYRPHTDTDGATPSSAGLALLGLVRTAALCGRRDFEDVIRSVLERYGPLLARAPHALPTLTRASALHDRGVGLALVVGAPERPETQRLAERARELVGCEDLVVVVAPGEKPDWLAADWLAGRDEVAVPTAYVCRGHACSLPATRPEALALP